MISQPYTICVIDIGSPKLGNIGWCILDPMTGQSQSGQDLYDLIPLMAESLQDHGMILGLEAPLFVPLRDDLMLATKARHGEGRRPWSAGAGAQVLAMNLPIMTYLFRQVKQAYPNVKAFLNAENFTAEPGQMMVFEALVSGADKGLNHMDDADIMAQYCLGFSKAKTLPSSILLDEPGCEYFNLTAASLMRCGLISDPESLQAISPIYKPSDIVLR